MNGDRIKTYSFVSTTNPQNNFKKKEKREKKEKENGNENTGIRL